MPLEKFELPRKDWYDKDGRIYKNILIENFNAIEEKLKELNKLTPYEVELPDFSTIDYEDTTLDSPSNKVVNLKSFIDILDLKYVPIKCEFVGTKCKVLSYYDKNYKYHEIRNKEVDDLGLGDNVYVVLDTTNDKLLAVNTIENLTDKLFLGVYDKDKLYHVHSPELADINILTALCNMSEETGFWHINRDTSIRTLVQNGRAYGAANAESKGAAMDLHITDEGRIL